MQLTWPTAATADVDGIVIERKTGLTGSYAPVASVEPERTDYTDSNLLDGTLYCYRIFTFNSAGNSPYSPEACGNTQSTLAWPTLTSVTTGTAGGGGTGAAPGSDCGALCVPALANSSAANPAAAPAAGSLFTGSSGMGCASGSAPVAGQPSCVLHLTWADNSYDEDGFIIERKAGVSGSYGQIASVKADRTEYRDTDLQDGTLYCYRVYAFNSAGKSPFSPEVCGIPRAALPYSTLTIAKGETGLGTVISAPAGIDCGALCVASFENSTMVNLTAAPAAGYIFTGWSGTGCANGAVTMTGPLTCVATFAPRPVPSFILTVGTDGAGGGTISSAPAGIDCGALCAASFENKSVVRLAAAPAAGYLFTGWSGTGCDYGTAIMTLHVTCIASFVPRPVPSFILTVAASDAGGGTVTSTPAGIDCSAVCAAAFDNTAVVNLTAIPVAGYVFTGWSGTGCANGSAMMTAAVFCVASFAPQPLPSYTVTVSKGGAGGGSVTSMPAGIDCGALCAASFESGAVVNLTAVPAAGYLFAGWSGTGCANGSFTVAFNTICTAQFERAALPIFSVIVSKAGTGHGTVTSIPAGLNCGNNCSAFFATGTVVALTAKPAAGYVFAGWTGAGCAMGSFTVTVNRACVAVFNALVFDPGSTRIGVFRPSTGEWFLDYNGNGQWDPGVDIFIAAFGANGELPLAGDWVGDGTSAVATFNPFSGAWKLDSNGNDQWDGCGVDGCVKSLGQLGDLPVARKLSPATRSVIGLFTAPTGSWNFAIDGNGSAEGSSSDRYIAVYGINGDLPVIGDWSGTGKEELGIFRTGNWYLDGNGNGRFDDCETDRCLGPFGEAGDMPVTGDWNNGGTAKIGVYRPSTGEWFLDLNGNGVLDSCIVDACLGPFGQPGDLPVVGKW